MAITHPVLVRISNSISDALGGGYLAIHFRAGDSQFEDASQSNARKIWWTLVHLLLNKTVDQTLELEQRIKEPHRAFDANSASAAPVLGPRKRYPPLDSIEKLSINPPHSPWLLCPKTRSRIFAVNPIILNAPVLYIATDLRNPRENPSLASFRHTFPCTFYLSDFTSELGPLDQLINPDDGVPLRPHLLPFLDALVAAKALRVVGTKGSTFSYYIEDLWKRFHDFPMEQHG